MGDRPSEKRAIAPDNNIHNAFKTSQISIN